MHPALSAAPGAEEAGLGLMKWLALVGLQFLSGCASGEAERLQALTEAEAYCGLPERILVDTYLRRQETLDRLPPSARSAEGDARLIYIDIVSDRRIIDKRDCIVSFRSSQGYRFNMHIQGPYSL
jgi:hypothetical protein